MRIVLIMLGLSALLFACPALSAQRHDAKARDITSREEYRSYRVEQPPGRQPGDGRGEGGDGEAGSDGGRTRGDGSGARRGTGAGGPERGTQSRGGGGSSGGGLAFPDWVGAMFQVIAWLVVIVGVLVALFFIVKALLGIKWKKKAKPQKSKASSKAGEAETEAEAIEDDGFDEQVFGDALEVAMREYKDAVAREDWAAATLLAYRIFWLRAGWQGCVEPSDTHTWRDALRMVRQAETRGRVRELLPMVERVRYAEHKPDKIQFNDWSLKLERINPQGVL